MNQIVQLFEEWNEALQIEINELKKQGGHPFPVYGGRCVRSTEKGSIYLFSLHTDLLLQEGMPIQLQYEGQKIKGILLSCEMFQLAVEVEAYLGGMIEEATIRTEPWELMEKLMERLNESKQSKKKRMRIEQLLFPSNIDRHPHEKVKNALHEVILRAKYNRVTYLWGPPGTGKTYTLSRCAAWHYLKGRKILLLSHSNAAINVLLSEVERYLKKKQEWKQGDIIRYGTVHKDFASTHKELTMDFLIGQDEPRLFSRKLELERERNEVTKQLTTSKAYQVVQRFITIEEEWQKLRDKMKKYEETILEGVAIIGTTLSKATIDPLIYENSFDLVFVDEASMAYVPQLAFAASLGKHIIVCGDFKQLPPIAVSHHPLVNHWLKGDLFHRAGIVEALQKQDGHPQLFLLKKQRRMHPDISAFTNQYIYGGKVEDHSCVKALREKIVMKEPFAGKAAVMLNTHAKGHFSLKETHSYSRWNIWSSFLALQLIAIAKEKGIQSIGYITPYRAQAKWMNVCLSVFFREEWKNQSISAATVHKFQGSEREMILFDTVDSSPQQQAGRLLIHGESDRLINVAMTRAKGKYVFLGDEDFLERHISEEKPIRKLQQFFQKNHDVAQLHDRNELMQTIHPQLRFFTVEAEKYLFADMRRAEKEIIVALPPKNKGTKKLWSILMKKQNEVSIKILCKLKNIPLQKVEKQSVIMPFSFFIIDQKIFWIDPLGQGEMSIRLHSRKIIQLFWRMFDAKGNREEILHQVKSENGPSFIKRGERTLIDYLHIWDRCPVCEGKRSVKVTKNGYIRLECGNCLEGGFLSNRQLDDYLYKNGIECRKCYVQLQAEWKSNRLIAQCPHCSNQITLSSLSDKG
ncbi:hypothetical protein J2S13_000458 [Oikeobacillus pervagus]|uniref:Helicase n=1 Tax=Oikeobacillus pervagus TaxID=1325931 RepID=A0AAJ1WI79_9BACI|nr:AAA domain-containing protein [Oikeobacillus pervagus]MDQ0214063.1 hypothetical protein [Oikeobacillus pervagus]